MLKHLPNALTVARLILAPVVAWAVWQAYAAPAETAEAQRWALAGAVLFILAALSDLLDGMAARALKAHSKFGRLVDPIASPSNPPEDAGILAALASAPATSHGGQYVVDPQDRRRGPFDLGMFFYHDWRQSPYHEDSLLCATCHEVSNPAFTRKGRPILRRSARSSSRMISATPFLR